jgi:hypothetical protein
VPQNNGYYARYLHGVKESNLLYYYTVRIGKSMLMFLRFRKSFLPKVGAGRHFVLFSSLKMEAVKFLRKDFEHLHGIISQNVNY